MSGSGGSSSTPTAHASPATAAREARTAWLRWLGFGLYALALVSLLLAWRYTSLGQWLSLDALAQLGRRIQSWPLAPLAVVAGYVLLVAMGLPVVVLVSLATVVFGPWWGMAYAMGGMLAGAVVTYGVGRLSGDLVDRLTGARMQSLAQGLRSHGLVAVIVVRVVPMAPFVLVNMTCGALRVHLRDYVLGTVIGLTPATVMFSLSLDRLAAAVRSPSVGTFAALAGCLLAVVLLGGYLKRRVQQRQPQV